MHQGKKCLLIVMEWWELAALHVFLVPLSGSHCQSGFHAWATNHFLNCLINQWSFKHFRMRKIFIIILLRRCFEGSVLHKQPEFKNRSPSGHVKYSFPLLFFRLFHFNLLNQFRLMSKTKRGKENRGLRNDVIRSNSSPNTGLRVW